MTLIVSLLVALLIGAFLYDLAQRRLRWPRAAGSVASHANTDPSIAAAAMMYVVASEVATVSAQQEQEMASLLASCIGLEAEAARKCMKQGRRLSRLDGDLTSRLHQLQGPIVENCTLRERQDLIEMLRKVAGPSGERIGPVRDAIGRLSASLRNA